MPTAVSGTAPTAATLVIYFCERVDCVRTRDGLEQVGVRELDRFLWLWGQWLTQNGNTMRVINSDTYEVLFVSTDPEIRQHVQALIPKDE